MWGNYIVVGGEEGCVCACKSIEFKVATDGDYSTFVMKRVCIALRKCSRFSGHYFQIRKFKLHMI